jgi:hypothetical protein
MNIPRQTWLVLGSLLPAAVDMADATQLAE